MANGSQLLHCVNELTKGRPLAGEQVELINIRLQRNEAVQVGQQSQASKATYVRLLINV